MRLFIYELISAGGLGANVPAYLRCEGAAMLTAWLEDFVRLPGINFVTLLADDAPLPVACRRALTSPVAEAQAFRDLARQSDAVLIVAPEFDNLLLDRTRWVFDNGCKLLG